MPGPCEKLYVDPDWNRLLGLTDEQIADLTLRDFARLCMERGFTPRLGRGGVAPGLTLEADGQEPVAITS